MAEDQGFEQIVEGDAADSNGESSGFRLVDAAEGQVSVSVSVEPLDVAQPVDSLNQGRESLPVAGTDTVKDDPNDVKAVEDGGKEDMFVDCPDELIAYDGRNTVVDNREAEEFPDIQQRLDKEDDMVETHFNASENGMHVPDLMGELEHLRNMLKKTVGEKESSAREDEEERRLLARELASLRLQLKALNGQQALFYDKDGGLVNHLANSDIGEGETKTLLLSTAQLHDMINECSKSIKDAVDEKIQTEGTIRELHAFIYMKDQEIGELSARITELSVSQDVVSSYLNSAQDNTSRSLDRSPELEKEQHIEAAANRLLASLSSAVNQDELFDESIIGKMSHIEKSTLILIDKYNRFLSEIDLLRLSMTNFSSAPDAQDEVEITFHTLCEELLELKRKEVHFAQKLSHLEDENRNLMEELGKNREMVEMANIDSGKLRTELEQERTRYGNTKEKLSLAVTKGKALVQQRDSLKQSLAEKASELEKCVIELQEKSRALEAAQLTKDELVRNETLVASLQEALLQRDTMLQQCKEILSESGATEEPQLMDIRERVRWLVNEKNELKGLSLEHAKTMDALSFSDLPETVLSSNLESQVTWLVESFYLAKDEAIKMQDETSRIREAANKEIDRLTSSFLAETQEKNYLQEECMDLTHKLEGIAKKVHNVSMEKDQIVGMLLEVSGIAMGTEEESYQPNSDMPLIIDRCFGQIKEQTRASLRSSYVEVEIFERIQSLLYIKDQESMLYEQMLEEEMLDRTEVSRLSVELVTVSQELHALKDERDTLQKSEEKAAILREKLSMAVKKGKGLVQERENMKQLLLEKNASIEKLRAESQQQESAFSDFRDQINKLSTEVERIPELEADFVGMKNQRDDLERYLMESNGMLERIMESLDGMILPFEFEEPVEKVKWLAEYFTECQDVKIQAEKDVQKAKGEASTLASILTDSERTVKSLENALSVEKNAVSKLAEERREVEFAKTYFEQELQKSIEEVSSQTSKFSEILASKKSLEDALSLAEDRTSVLISEKEHAQVSRAAAEMELQKVKEDVSVYTTKLAEAQQTVQSLEDAMSQVQTNVSLLAEENDKGQVGRTNLEDEIKKLKEEAESQATKFADASSTIRSLEDALSKAESTVTNLADEKKNAEQEISTLKYQLNECMQGLAGAHANMENKSLELSTRLYSLQSLLKDDTLLSLLRESFDKKFASLKDMDLLLKEISDCLGGMNSNMLQTYPFIEESSSASSLFPGGLDNVVNIEVANGEAIAADGDSLMLHIGATLENFYTRNKILTANFNRFSTFLDEAIAVLLAKSQAAKDKMIVMLEHITNLRQNMNNMENYKQVQENKIGVLENNIEVLLSACTTATRELEFAVDQDVVADHQARLYRNEYDKTAEKLLSAARNVQDASQQFQDTRNMMTTKIQELQNKLQETCTTCEKAIEERDQYQSNLEALENECSEMRLKLEGYQGKEDKLKDREADPVSFQTFSSVREQESEEPLLSASEVKFLLDKIRGVEIPSEEFEMGNLDPHDSVHVNKLSYIIGSFKGLQHQMMLLSRDKELLQSALAKQALDIEHLEEELEEHVRDKQDLDTMKNELFELASGLENIIQKLGGNQLVGGQKSAGAMELLLGLEKLIMAVILESENSKSKVQELGAKLQGTQKVVDELSSKVKLLEEYSQDRPAAPETIQERGVFEAPSLPNRTEISEIEDAGPLGRNAIPPAASAAHARTLRKGSNDHLAINVDLESERLVSNEETDEDKGHAFKSLNTSGLVPRQGKMMADRIDGIWVSGGRALMSRPRARLGLIAYWLLLHIWLLGAIL